ncbi:hypothetical protein BOX15_Mlig005275g1 [Macrostomum lignano]|uniref:Major facilitator superfamily (MFS) profile domain-containing protein n=1 Tax=Macrostomum lignano TaxID=282301 RepID=A0A267DKF8_9PLAT|nr:hypothetical protein BOX15_Mlig005275g1 [Macrostomum lignano]
MAFIPNMKLSFCSSVYDHSINQCLSCLWQFYKPKSQLSMAILSTNISAVYGHSINQDVSCLWPFYQPISQLSMAILSTTILSCLKPSYQPLHLSCLKPSYQPLSQLSMASSNGHSYVRPITDFFQPNFLQMRALLQYNITSDKQLKQILSNGTAATRNSGSSNNNSSGTSNEVYNQIQLSISTAESDAAIMLVCINISSSVARLVIGKLADSQCMNRVHLQQAAYATLGLSILLLPPSNHRVLTIRFSLALLFGLCDGAVVCLMGPIAFDLVGPSGASQAIGFLLLAMSVPTTVGPLLAGYINDVTNRWDVPFYLSGLLPIVAAIIMFLIPQTAQTYPAVCVVENFDQNAKSNLDIHEYRSSQIKDADNGWTRVSVTSANRQTVKSLQATNAVRRSLPVKLTASKQTNSIISPVRSSV